MGISVAEGHGNVSGEGADSREDGSGCGEGSDSREDGSGCGSGNGVGNGEVESSTEKLMVTNGRVDYVATI